MDNSILISLLSKIKTPFFLLLTLITINLLVYFRVLPPTIKLTQAVVYFFERYGLFAVFLMSFFENLIIINLYFPGSIVILVAMSLTAGNPLKAIITFFFIVGPSIGVQSLNYYIGYCTNQYSNRFIRLIKNFIRRTKFQKENSGLESTTKNGNFEIWLKFISALWHPQLASFICFNAGLSKMRFKVFLRYFLIVSFFWNIFWGIVMYNFGQTTKLHSTLVPVSYIYLCGWIVLIVIKFFKEEYYKAKEPKSIHLS